MKTNIEIRNFEKGVKHIYFSKGVQEILRGSKNITLKLKRSNMGDASKIEDVNIFLKLVDIEKNIDRVVFSSSKQTFNWGEEWEINLPDGISVTDLELSHSRDTGINLSSMIFEVEENYSVNNTTVDIVKYSWDKCKEIINENTKPISFEEFQSKALHKLQRQFLSIPDTKDTVLTRKNIVEMIKDLKELI
ncbi:hypothetical protein AF332_12070 [Sporosarcina globispora]|uniref:Uncharacterized protein n=1 Tax=Sporosarcina globispora TaxID=1459 RepID=A0A0M0GDJ2_SPOGL|nr:hypothetical protein [Sporosarcina globispora]KON87491.1 hypothetical protein AF332_12070 [Sporosarcina globispora]